MKKESLFDKVFHRCLRSFHTELKSTLSVHLQVIGVVTGQKDGEIVWSEALGLALR